MEAYEFNNWIAKFCPDDMDASEFVARLAVGTIALIEEVSKNTGRTIPDLIKQFDYDGFGGSQLS